MNIILIRKWKKNDPYRDGLIWNFTDNSDPCLSHWQGIYCDTITSCNFHIFSFDLSGYEIHGSIPKEVGNYCNY